MGCSLADKLSIAFALFPIHFIQRLPPHQLYTVVQKVKEAHVCQERGETQHLLDDVEYLIDGLADHNQTNTRALRSVFMQYPHCLVFIKTIAKSSVENVNYYFHMNS